MENPLNLGFYPLQVKSYYSFFDSAMKPEEYALGLLQNNYPGGAVVDFMAINGLPRYTSALRDHNLKMISGMEISLTCNDNTFQLLLYIQNEEGYQSILHLLNSGKNLFEITDLCKSRGLAAILKTSNQYFFSDFEGANNRFLLDLYSIFPVFYLGIEIYSESEIDLAVTVRNYASKHNLKTIAIPEVKYLSKKYLRRYTLLQALKLQKKIEDIAEDIPTCYFLLSPSALLHLYTEDEIKATTSLAESCDFSVFAKRGEIFHVHQKKEDSDKELKDLITHILDEKSCDKNYQNRAEYELSMIAEMGFSDYFLIVRDYVHYAKTHDIKVGPGRGSAASSIISFLLEITEIDPIKHKLIFERFLNPFRVTMPDIDIDFEDTKREQIITYLKNKYGENRVMQIITYSNYKSASSVNALMDIREDGRPEFVKRITSCLRPNISLEDSLKSNEKIIELTQDSFYRAMLDDAILLEGFPNNTSKHASGIILSDSSLYDLVPAKDGIISFEFPDLEKMGFLKLDILGLTNLSFLRKIEERIIAGGGTLPIVDDEHTEDSAAYLTLNKLNTLGIFQLESPGMKDAIETIKPSCFDDLIALIALYRPGPMDNIPLYAKNKNNPLQISHYGNEIDNILADTNNILIYQEQILAIIQQYAGLSAGTADLFRRAITKKDFSKMEKYKSEFIDGAKARGKSVKEINDIYALIEKFASYGFNKAHSTSYALIAYKLLVYKTYFPLEFYQTLLENGTLTSKNGYIYKKEINALGLKLKGPSLPYSKNFLNKVEDRVYFPWSTIKGLEENSIKVLSEESFHPDFRDIIEVFQYLLDKNVSEKDLKKLIDAGSFDKYEPNREKLRFNFDNLAAANYIEKTNSIPLITVDPQPIEDYIREYTVCGYVFSTDLRVLTNVFYTRDFYIILHALNSSKTQFEALNDYGIITLLFSEPFNLQNSTIIQVTKGRFIKNGRYVDEYKEVKYESH